MSSVESSLVLSEKGICYDQCVLLTELLAFALLHFVPPGQTCQDTDLAYCDVEWFALETNRNHSVIFDVPVIVNGVVCGHSLTDARTVLIHSSLLCRT